MRTDDSIKRDVEAELRWSPGLDEKDIAVNVTDKVVALTGLVHSFLEKTRAEDAAKRVAGVAGIANDLEVRLVEGLSDPEIAREVVAALHTQLPALHEKLTVVVRQGRVTLEGALEWNYERDMVASTVRRVPGVTDINNHITLRPRVVPAQVSSLIEEAFRRSATMDAHRILVEAEGGVVTLRGNVPSWSEREEAQRTAWAAPGVTKVRNEITIGL